MLRHYAPGFASWTLFFGVLVRKCVVVECWFLILFCMSGIRFGS